MAHGFLPYLIVLLFSLAPIQAQTSLDISEAARPNRAAVDVWKARKFGMFIHFGLYSALGGKWQGKEVHNGYSEQIMSHAPIPLEQYSVLAKGFDPKRFDPDAIVQLAKRAGMKYIVLTSKHHDGFNMFHTRLTDYNIVDATPYRKDVVKQLADACARGGLKFGVYYSSIDWHYPGATTWTDDNNNPIPKAHEDFNVGQLKELLSNYGPITEIWFDMGKPTSLQSRRFTNTVHHLQPECMVSGRVFNHQGDFTVMGDNQISDFVIDEPWQTPASIYTDTWGYRSWEQRDDLQGKITEHILNMAEVVSRGGNYLLNIGPKGDGSIVDFEAQVLEGVGSWLRTNGEAIYESQPQPFRKLSFGYATTKGNKLYLLVRNWPSDGFLKLPGLQNKIANAYLLADAKRTHLQVENETERAVHVPRVGETAPLTTVVVEFSGPLSVIPPVHNPDAKGIYKLIDREADHFLNYNGEGYSDPATTYKEQWDIGVPKKQRYQITVSYEKPTKVGSIQLTIGGRSLNAPLKGDASRTVTMGTLDLPASPWLKVQLTPPQPFTKGTALVAKISRIELRPVR